MSAAAVAAVAVARAMRSAPYPTAALETCCVPCRAVVRVGVVACGAAVVMVGEGICDVVKETHGLPCRVLETAGEGGEAWRAVVAVATHVHCN